MTNPLPRCAPSERNIDARGVVAFLDAIDGVGGIEPHGIVLLRHGYVVAEGWWAPYAADRVQLLYSLSKSFTSTAAGFACAEGLLDLDAPVVSYFPELDAEVTDPRSRAILVRHIAAMAAGHTSEQWDRALAADREEPVRGFLLDPPGATPGVTFAYSQSTTYTLAAIVQRVTGRTLVEYLRPRLLDPLGIDQALWQEHPKGRNIGFSGLYATTEAVARLGQLYLRGGVWEGRRLLPAEWVAQATRAQVDNSATGAPPDWSQGYGFQFWMARHGYRGDGAYGQFCVVLPEQDAVLALTAEAEDMQAVLDAAWTHLLPAFGGRGSAAADQELARRLTGLQLQFVPGQECEVPNGAFTAARSAIPGLERIALAPGELTLYEKDGTVTALPLVPGSWPVSGHLAARAARVDEDTVTVHLQFVETPHKLRIQCDLRAKTFQAVWHTVPLGARDLSLAALRAPRG
ncbi:serine hydrolase domain-containing protein [Kitasatospora sp. NPDC006697]|uniref:serine hydrolase domain-containing protein n=1 Tax=Kitasatospora sp. NPDC006697 TaxID=3364020 RepID=UPI0036C348F8